MTHEQIVQKLTSRKFWLCVAAFLGSIATSITGIATKNDTVTTLGMICGILSAAIYAAAEAYVDGARLKSPYDHVDSGDDTNA